ncbi:perlucin-like [Mytilus galloprovincialis]|uniref:perlucin-like n=1 Tax=Mytilus galloprovincialis TaxID=29158 RepID=UPI003F7C4FE8
MKIALQISFLPVVLIIISTGSTKRFTLTHDQKYSETFIKNISAPSTIVCAMQCIETSVCNVYSYNNVGEICLIHSTDNKVTQISMQTDSKWGIYEPDKVCPNDWDIFQSFCYYFSADERNWTDSKTSCHSQDSMMAEVVSIEQLDFLTAKASEYGSQFYFLGGSDILTEGKWIWTTSQTNFTVTNWIPGEPNNAQGNEHCLAMKGAGYQWNDVKCAMIAACICQRPLL